MSIQVEILTPDQVVYQGEASGVKVPGIQGSFEILDNHAPVISTLGKGTIRLRESQGGEKTFQSNGGVVEVLKNKVIILVERIS